jgi:hypothetical protein
MEIDDGLMCCKLATGHTLRVEYVCSYSPLKHQIYKGAHIVPACITNIGAKLGVSL